jgi:hypothetical protein
VADAMEPRASSPSPVLNMTANALAIRTVDSREQPLEAAVVIRVRAEFNEMRGFSPTCDQAARLFGLSREQCERVLGSLTTEGFLRKDGERWHRVGP